MDVDGKQLQKLNLLLTYGGVLVPRNGTGKVRCIGGETRMVSFSGKADVTFSKLHSKIFDLFFTCKPYPNFLLLQYLDPYAPPNLMDDRPSLVRIANDGDVRRMVEVNERAVAEGKAGRIRVFVWECGGGKGGGLGFGNGGGSGDLGGSWGGGGGDLGRKDGGEVGFIGESNNSGIGGFQDCGRRPVRIGDGMVRNLENGVSPVLDSLSFRTQTPPRVFRRIPQSLVFGGSDVAYEIEGGQEELGNCEMTLQTLKSSHGLWPRSNILKPPPQPRIVLIDKTSDVVNSREQQQEETEAEQILLLPTVKKPPPMVVDWEDKPSSSSTKVEEQAGSEIKWNENLFVGVHQQVMPNVLDVKFCVHQEEQMKNRTSSDKSSCCDLLSCAANDPIHVSDLERNKKDISKCGKISLNYPQLAIQELQIIKNSDLDLLRKLGSGNYGTVFYGKWMGSDVAIKRIKPSFFSGSNLEADRLVSDLSKEAYLMAQLHHPNVLAFYGITTDGPETNLAIITEYMVNGSLKQVLQKNDSMDRRQRLIIAMDAASGMLYLHDKNIIHFDLKSQNFLVNMKDPQRPICKIGDLGLSKTKRRALIFDGVRGTISWMAPELLSGSGTMVTEKVDVFSFGIIMWELLTGKEPYENMPFEEIIDGITKGNLRPTIPCWCDPEWRSLMERCWSSDPKMRPSFSDIASELRQIAATMNIR